MVGILGLASLVVFVLASLIVGGRVLLLARRTGGLPEWTLGLSLVSAGAFGTAFAILPFFAPDAAPRLLHVTDQAGLLMNHLGFGLLFYFVWSVFRRGEVWATAFFGALMAALGAGLLGSMLTLEVGEHTVGETISLDLWDWLSLAVRTVGYAWAAVESFLYYSKLRRRVGLGLADPAVARRFLHWGVSLSAVLGIWLTIILDRLTPRRTADWTELVSALLGFVVAAGLWKAFFSQAPEPEPHEATAGATP